MRPGCLKKPIQRLSQPPFRYRFPQSWSPPIPGIFIPLIVVNCIVLGRAEAFAAKNGVVASFADGLGIGVGFTLSLTALAIVREVLGNGTFYDIPVFGPTFEPFSFMVQAPGAFVCLGLMLCIMNMLGKR